MHSKKTPPMNILQISVMKNKHFYRYYNALKLELPKKKQDLLSTYLIIC